MEMDLWHKCARTRRGRLEATGAFDFPIAVGRHRPLRVCAVQRRRFPVGESPTRQVLQPEATGATVEVTKRLKPSG